MKRQTLTLILLLFGCMTAFSASPKLGAYFSHGIFNIPGGSPYLETYIEIMGNTLTYKATEAGKFKGEVQITLIIKQDSTIKDFRKYVLQSPEVTDTVNVAVNFIDQQRFMIDPGNYDIELSIIDLNNPEERPSFVTYPVSVEFSQKDISIASIQLVKELKKTVEENPLSKSGYDIIPMVDNFFGPTVNKLTFYTEIYNPMATQNPEDRFLISSYIESFESRKMLNNFVQIKRDNATPVKVILSEFDITDLPTGNYNLVVSVRDKNNTILAQQVDFFQRMNTSIQAPSEARQAQDATNTFATQITDIEAMREFIRSLRPISTESDKLFINTYNNITDLKSLQQFFYNFWLERNPEKPEEAWRNYHNEVIKANNTYSTQTKKGYDTDMGRVYLQYGQPNSITDVPYEAGGMLSEGTIPYQIWHYYDLDNGRQRNKKFVFASRELRSSDYTLIHSDAIGEIQSWGWQDELQRRPASQRTEDEMRKDRSRTGTFYKNPF